MEYSVGVYDMPESIGNDEKLNNLINRLAKDRWSIRWMGTSYRNTKLIIVFERMRID